MKKNYQRKERKSNHKFEVVRGQELLVRVPLPMAEVWAEMQTQVEETSRRLLPLESSNHGSLGQDKHRPNYTYAGTYTITARLTECACRCKKGAACRTEA